VPKRDLPHLRVGVLDQVLERIGESLARVATSDLQLLAAREPARAIQHRAHRLHETLAPLAVVVAAVAEDALGRVGQRTGVLGLHVALGLEVGAQFTPERRIVRQTHEHATLLQLAV